MRLVDADELIKDRVENDPVRIAAICAPTAYNVDKVMERLSELNDNEFYYANIISIIRFGGIE